MGIKLRKKKDILIKVGLSVCLATGGLTQVVVPTSLAASNKTVTVNVSGGSNLYLRQKASTKSKIIAKVKKGTKLTVVKKQGKWTKVRYKNKLLYAYTKYLMFPPTQKEYVEIAKVKGKSLQESTTTFKEQVNNGKLTTIANTTYDKFNKEANSVSSYIKKNIKSEKNKNDLMDTYVNPAKAQLNRVKWEKEALLALQDTNNLINNLKFKDAHTRFDDVADYRGRGEALRKSNNLEALPVKVVTYLDAKTKEVENRFSFSHIEQMPYKDNYGDTSLLPLNKTFKNNRNVTFSHGYKINESTYYLNLRYIYLNNDRYSGNYTRFTATFTLGDYWKTHTVGSGNYVGTLKINGDKYMLQDGDEPIEIDMDISSLDKLEIYYYGEGNVGLVNAKLYREE